MTLKQLLDSLTFEEIAPFIGKYDDRNPLAPFKQDFDFLRHLAPDEGSAGEARIGFCRDEEWADGAEDARLFAGAFEGIDWQSSLAKTLVLDDDVKASAAEIAACCLWHTSFYGFYPEDLQETFESWHEGRETVNRCLEKFGDIIPPRAEMLAVPSFHRSIRRKMHIHRSFRRTEDDTFLSGIRMWKWRYWKRYEINREFGRRVLMNSKFIADVLERGTNVTEPPARKEFGRLFRANHVSIHRCDTFAYDASSRLDYFRELVEKYGLLKEEMCLANSFVCISASPEHPLTMQEISEVESLVTSGHGGEHRFFIKSNDFLGEELRVDIAYYE
jgi:hypothetical protein